MHPCEAVVKSGAQRSLCPCQDYTGDEQTLCTSCNHSFSRHVEGENDVAPPASPFVSQYSQVASLTAAIQGTVLPATSSRPRVNLTNLLERRLNQAGVLPAKILSAAEEANKGLNGTRRKPSAAVAVKKSAQKSSSSHITSRDQDNVEIAGIVAYPIGLQHNERGVEQAVFSAARSSNYYLFRRCGLLAPKEEGKGLLTIRRSWSHRELNDFLKSVFPWLGWLEGDVGGEQDGFSSWALLFLEKKGSKSTMRVVLESYPSAEVFLRHGSPIAKKPAEQYIHIATRTSIPYPVLEQYCYANPDCAPSFDYNVLWETLRENEGWPVDGSDEEDLSLSRTRKGKSKAGGGQRIVSRKRRYSFSDSSDSGPQAPAKGTLPIRKRGRISIGMTPEAETTDSGNEPDDDSDVVMPSFLTLTTSMNGTVHSYVNPWNRNRSFEHLFLPNA